MALNQYTTLMDWDKSREEWVRTANVELLPEKESGTLVPRIRISDGTGLQQLEELPGQVVVAFFDTLIGRKGEREKPWKECRKKNDSLTCPSYSLLNTPF